MLAITDQEWSAISVVVALVVGGPGGAKVVSLFRRVLTLADDVEKLKKDKAELRSLLDMQADELAMVQLTMNGIIEVRDYAMFILDQNGRTVFVSQSMARMLGMSRDDSLNGNFFDAIASTDRTKVNADWKDFFASTRRTVLLKFKFTMANGQTKPVRLKLTRLTLKAGVGRVIGYMTDDTAEPAKSPSTAETAT